MTILFGGGEMGSFVPSSSSAIESTTSGTFDGSFARCALNITGSSDYADSIHFTETADTWTHIEIAQNTFATDSSQMDLLTWRDGVGGNAFRFSSTTPNSGQPVTFQLWYWTAGAAWATLGPSFTATSQLQTFDFHIVAGTASGSGTVYMAGTERSTGSADLSHIDGIGQLRGNGKSVGIPATVSISQPIVSTESTIGWRLTTAPATGAGTTTDWTGTYAEIDETVYSDADFVNSSTNAQVELFSHSTTVPSGYRVKGVIVAARAKKGSTGPSNLQLVLKSGGTTSTSSSQALDLGYGAHVAVWETDPATSAAFTASSIAALQFGVKAIT